MNKDLGATTIVITHNLVIADMAHRIINMVDGRISETRENTNRLSPRDIHW